MSEQKATLVVGGLVFTVTAGVWLGAEAIGVSTGPLLALAGPVIAALFLAGPVGSAARDAQTAANQTNGGLDQRVKAAVSAALADRDAARTRQALGDIGAPEIQTERTEA